MLAGAWIGLVRLEVLSQNGWVVVSGLGLVGSSGTGVMSHLSRVSVAVGDRQLIQRGFRPGQYVTDDFPVLSAGPTPNVPLDQWSFTIRGASGRADDVDMARVRGSAE